jgi:hypothetical protein
MFGALDCLHFIPAVILKKNWHVYGSECLRLVMQERCKTTTKDKYNGYILAFFRAGTRL